MALKIYTKTGDRGKTSLIGGKKVSKAHLRIESYGTVDELNSYIGLCKDLLTDEIAISVLATIQDKLFSIGSALACDPEKPTPNYIPELNQSDIEYLEKQIDQMELKLEPLKAFILPGGHPTLSHLHIARAVCRRAERCCVRLADETAVNSLVIQYLNRLSDYLFVLTRYTGHQLQIPDICWRSKI